MNPWVEIAERRSTPEPNTGCWLWTGAVTARGRASVNVGNHKTDMLSRRILGLAPGDRKVACHTCDNGHLGCVNPAHLYAGTQADNVRDYRFRRAPAGWGDGKTCPHCGGPVERKVYGKSNPEPVYRCAACCSKRYREWKRKHGPREKSRPAEEKFKQATLTGTDP